MGIINIQENWSGQSGGGQTRTEDRVLTVLCDGPMTRLELARQPGIPRAGEAHPKDAWLRAEYPVIRAKAPWYFEVSIHYAVPGASEFDNPLNAPPDRRWGWAVSTEPVDMDLDGKPIVNAAGDAFKDPQPTQDVYDPLYTITRNEGVFGPAVALAYNDALNADFFMGAPPGSAWLRVESEEVHTRLQSYWRTSYAIQFRVNARDQAGFNLRILNQGLNARYQTGSDDAEVRPVIDKRTGTVVAHPVLLDATGRRILAEELKGGLKKVVWLQFRLKRRVAFAPLHLV